MQQPFQQLASAGGVAADAIVPNAGELRRGRLLAVWLALSVAVHGLLLVSPDPTPRPGVAPEGTLVQLVFAQPEPAPEALPTPPAPVTAENRPEPPTAETQPQPSPAKEATDALRERERPQPRAAERPQPTVQESAPVAPAPAPTAPAPAEIAQLEASPPTATAAEREAAPRPKAQAAPAAPSTEAVQQRLRQRLELSLRHHFEYPMLARRYGWEGRVDVGLRVEANGDLSGVHVVRTSGHALLDRAAVSTLGRIARLPNAAEWLQGRHFDMVLPVQYRLVDG